MGIIQYLRLLFNGRSLISEAVKQGAVVKDVQEKSGFKSSEFVLSSIVALAAVLAQAQGLVPAPYGTLIASVSGALYAIARGLAKNGDPLGGAKAGPLTSEFLITLLIQVGSIASAVAGTLSPEAAAIAMTISNGAYALSRGLAKGGAQPEAALSEGA